MAGGTDVRLPTNEKNCFVAEMSDVHDEVLAHLSAEGSAGCVFKESGSVGEV